MLSTDYSFVHHIVAEYLHLNGYNELCNTAVVSPRDSYYNVMRHFGKKYDT